MKIETSQRQRYGLIAVAGYTGTMYLGKRLGKVVGDPATVELASHVAVLLKGRR